MALLYPITIANTGSVTYTYTVNPNVPNGSSGSSNTNTVLTNVNVASIDYSSGGLVKSGTPSTVKLGDVITYSITLTNTGNTSANNVVFIDTIPAGTSLAYGSANPNPPTGISLGSISAGASTNVTFSVVLVTLPTNATTISNTASVKFTYTVNPSIPNGATGTGNSNTVITNTSQAVIDAASGGLIKSGTPSTVKLGDTLTYTITLTNTGNTSANNVVFIDTIPAGTSLAYGSVNPNPPNGINLGSILVGASKAVSFSVIVVTLPTNATTIVNYASVKFTYTANPSIPNGATGTGNSNLVTTNVAQAIIDTASGGLVKSGNPSTVKLGDTVTYTITLTNTGNTSANNVVFIDTIPAGTSLAYGSSDPNPPNGINLGNIAAGSSSVVTFSVIVVTLPTNATTIVNAASVKFTYTANPSIPNGATGTGNSNLVTTNVAQAIIDTASGGLVKSGNPSTVKLGDTVTYTITLTNTGNTSANNIVFIDTIPYGTSLVSGNTNTNPPGISLGNIAPGASSVVKFSVIVVTLPINSTTISNTASVKFTYTADPSIPNGATGTGNSNRVITNVSQAIIGGNTLPNSGFTKSSSKAYADLGDIITYTIIATNTGNIPATNVVVMDTLPNGLIFNTNSLTINGSPDPSNPNIGISLGTLAPNATSTIVFTATVITLPNPNPIVNKATVTYNYTQLATLPNGGTGTGTTNPTPTTISHGEINPQNVTKTSNRSVTAIGDVITYTLTAKNTGNAPVSNVNVIDTVKPPTVFINNSVSVDGVSIPGANPDTGISIGTIPAGSTTTITFTALVTSTVPSTVTNTANFTYNYTVDPTNPPVVGPVVPTPTNTIPNLLPDIQTKKTSSRNGALVGDTITYTLIVTNSGQLNATNITVKDPLTPNLQYKDSLMLNGSSIGGDITQGVNIGTLLIGQSATLTFKALITSLPNSGVTTNTASSTYQYIVPGGVPQTKTQPSNPNNINTYIANLQSSKVPQYTNAIVGHSFSYTILVKNTGNIDANNAIIQDTIPSAFKVKDVTVDGVSVGTGIATGINIGTISVNQTKTIIVNLDVVSAYEGIYKNVFTTNATVNTDPTKPPEPITSIATDTIGVKVYNPVLDLTKSVDKPYAIVGDTVTYTIVATNAGNISLGDISLNPVIIYDLLSPDLQFIAGSVTINGVANPTSGIAQGINLGVLDIGQSDIVTFKALIVSNTNPSIPNNSSSTFGYQVPGYPSQVGNIVSNTVILYPQVANISVNKTADKSFAILGDTINYTVTLNNTGSLDATNVIFVDTLPTGITLIDGSFSINGIVINNIDLSQGINIGSIPKKSTAILKYSVKVVAPSCSMSIVNEASVNFNYTLANGTTGRTSSKPSSASSVSVDLGITNFKQMSLEEYLQIPCQKPDIEEVNKIGGDIDIIRCHVIQTSKVSSTEGQKLTGYKLIIHGILKATVEYTACDEVQSVHSSNYDIPFSTFIVLPSSFVLGSKIEVEGMIEDIYNQTVDCRTFFINATVLINGKIISC